MYTNIWVYLWEGGAEIACDRQRQYLCLFLARIGSERNGSDGHGHDYEVLVSPFQLAALSLWGRASGCPICSVFLCIVLWARLIVLCPQRSATWPDLDPSMGISAALFASDFIILRWMWENCKQARNLTSFFLGCTNYFEFTGKLPSQLSKMLTSCF